MTQFHQNDGSTSVLWQGKPVVPELYPVAVSKPEYREETREIAERLEAQCGVHFLERGDPDEPEQYSEVPMTVFAKARGAWFAVIDEDSDGSVGIIFSGDAGHCYPAAGSLSEFLRLAVSCPDFLERFHPGQSLELTLPGGGVSAQGTELLARLKLKPLTAEELRGICAEYGTLKPLPLRETEN